MKQDENNISLLKNVLKRVADSSKMLKPASVEYLQEVAGRFDAEKIPLFGSCLEKDQDEANDIDLLFYGLDVFRHWDMMREIMWAPELDNKTVDLVRAEDDLPIMVYAKKGVLVDERVPERRRETISV